MDSESKKVPLELGPSSLAGSSSEELITLILSLKTENVDLLHAVQIEKDIQEKFRKVMGWELFDGNMSVDTASRPSEGYREKLEESQQHDIRLGTPQPSLGPTSSIVSSQSVTNVEGTLCSEKESSNVRNEDAQETRIPTSTPFSPISPDAFSGPADFDSSPDSTNLHSGLTPSPTVSTSVKREDDNEIRPPSSKKRKFVFDGVVITSRPPSTRPTKKRLFSIKDEPVDDETIASRLASLENPDVKIKDEIRMDSNSVYDRLKLIDFSTYLVELDEKIKNVMVPRAFISDTYGGNLRQTLPMIKEEKLRIHGYDNWMMVNLDFNPESPQHPGYPGLFFATRAFELNKEMRLFVKYAEGKWNYMGQYVNSLAPPLTAEEWNCQSEVVKRTWSTRLSAKWGKWVRARIILRRELGREPTEDEVDEAMVSKEAYDNVTVQEIRDAYALGYERIVVWCMKCVGYDVDFQKEIVRKRASWVPTPKTKTKTKTKTKKKGGKQKSKVKTRSLVVDVVQPESEEDVLEQQYLSDEMEGLDEEPQYTPRGTRSRPRPVK